MASMGVSFGRALLMVRGSNGVATAVNFYQNALGLAVVRHTDEWAELTCPVSPASPSIKFHLSIQSVESEAQLGVGYSPFLSFDVDDMDSAIARCVQMGGNLDGPIQYPGKLCYISVCF